MPAFSPSDNVPPHLPTRQSTIKIHVQSVGGSLTTIDIPENASLGDLKRLVQERTGIDAALQRLTLPSAVASCSSASDCESARTVLVDHERRPLVECGVGNETTLQVSAVDFTRDADDAHFSAVTGDERWAFNITVVTLIGRRFTVRVSRATTSGELRDAIMRYFFEHGLIPSMGTTLFIPIPFANWD